jgi:replicative DNA helicase
MDRVGDLQSRHFFRQDHRLIFSEIMRQLAAGLHCDVISVGVPLADTVHDCMPYLNSMCQSVPSAANIARYADLAHCTEPGL